MKTFTQYAQERSINTLANTLVAEGYDVEEVVSYMNYVIESNDGQDGEVVLNELLSGLLNTARGLAGGAIQGLKSAAGGVAQGLGAAGKYVGDKYRQGEQSAQLQAAMKQLNGVAATLQKLGVTNPQVQQLFQQINTHLTQLGQQVAGDRTARFGQGGMNMQMPGAAAPAAAPAPTGRATVPGPTRRSVPGPGSIFAPTA